MNQRFKYIPFFLKVGVPGNQKQEQRDSDRNNNQDGLGLSEKEINTKTDCQKDH